MPQRHSAYRFFEHCIGPSLVLLLAASPAHADDTKRECVEASTAGQTSRDAGKLHEARDRFLVCSRDACPAAVRPSCNRWLAEVEALTPSVVVRVADAVNTDITEGTMTIDGDSYALDGKTIQLDPGKHVVVVFTSDGARVEKKVLVAAGEKSRLLELRLEKPKAAKASEPATAAPEPAAPLASDRKSTIPTGSWVLGGVSVVALGSFGVFAVSASSELSKLKKACSPSCTDEQTRTGRTNALVADVSLGVGVVALAGAVTWALLAAPSSHESASAARLSIGPLERGGYASFSQAF